MQTSDSFKRAGEILFFSFRFSFCQGKNCDTEFEKEYRYCEERKKNDKEARDNLRKKL